MTKLSIHETLEGDWIHGLDRFTVEQAITWLSWYPPNAVLDVNWTGYEDVQGDIEVIREETDEEYSCRLEHEEAQRKDAQSKRDKKVADDRKNIDDTVANLQKQIEELKKVRP